MRLLALDYGTKRLGLAWADTTLGVVLPFGVIAGDSAVKKAIELVRLIEKEKIDLVVVGFPLGLNGQENANTERVKKFVFELQKYTSVPVEYSDERLSSQAGDRLGPGVSRDEKAAMVILESYLASKNKRGKS